MIKKHKKGVTEPFSTLNLWFAYFVRSKMFIKGIIMFPGMDITRLKRKILIILDFENGFLLTYLTLCPGLDENGGSSEFVHNIWICYKLQCTKFCTLQ